MKLTLLCILKCFGLFSSKAKKEWESIFTRVSHVYFQGFAKNDDLNDVISVSSSVLSHILSYKMCEIVTNVDVTDFAFTENFGNSNDTNF